MKINYGSSVTSAADKTAYSKVTSEEFAKSQVTSYISMIGATSHCGGANWIFSDSISHGRVTSEVARVSGEVDATMLEKEAYWVDKVIFGTGTSCHLIGHWNYTTGTTKDVYAVAKGSNIKSAILTVTDEDGVETTYNGTVSSSYLWTFKDVEWKKGSVRVDFKNTGNMIQTSDSITTHGEATSIRITPVSVGQTLYANGSDVLLLDVEILDANGNRCETFDGVRDNIYTYFTVNSQTQNQTSDSYCVWRGGYNSSIEDSTNNKYLYIESGITRVALKTTMQAGTISVTASTTVNGNVLTDTYTTTSTAVDNTNGYSTLENYTPSYSLTGLTNPGVGNGAIPSVITDDVETSYVSELMDNMGYTGSLEPSWNVKGVLENGAEMYNDISDTFTSVPYRYLNSEYFQVPSVDNSVLAVDLVNFVTLKDVDVMVFRDPNVPNPEWMSSFTKTEDVVTGSNGVVYDVYKKSYSKGKRVTLGSNGETSDDGAKGAMYIVAVKETSEVENSVFFNPSLDSLNAWKYVAQTGTAITPETLNENQTLHFTDSNGSTIAYAYRQFANLTGKFNFKYSIYVEPTLNSTAVNNKFIRIFLHQGEALSNTDTKTNVNIETYITEATKWSSRTGGKEEALNEYDMTTTSTWHDIQYNVDTTTEKFSSIIDGTTVVTNASFDYSNLGGTNYCTIGTGKNQTNNFYIKDLSVEPVQDTTITDIKIDGQSVHDFNTYTLAYKIDATNNPTITVTQGSTFSSYTSEISEDGEKVTIIAYDTDGTSKTYTVYLEIEDVNKTELRSILSRIDGIDKDCYTTESVNELNTVVTKANNMLTKNMSKAKMNSIIVELREKTNSLVIDRNATNTKYNQ